MEKQEQTQRSKDKAKENMKFDYTIYKEFTNEKNRQLFGHMCGKCQLKWRCYKWGNAIVMQCDQFLEKIKVEK